MKTIITSSLNRLQIRTLSFLFLLILCLSPVTGAIAQGGFSQGKFEVGIHVSPLSLLSIRPRLDMGLVLKTEKVMYLLNVGFKVGNYSSPYANNVITPSRLLFATEIVSFVGLQPEIRLMLNRGERHRSSLGIGLILNRSAARSNFLLTERIDGQRFATDDYLVVRYKTGLVLSYGKLVRLAHWGYVHFYTGLGGSIRRIQTENESIFFPWLDEEGNIAERFRGSSCCNPMTRVTRVVPELQLGFRFGVWVK